MNEVDKKLIDELGRAIIEQEDIINELEKKIHNLKNNLDWYKNLFIELDVE